MPDKTEPTKDELLQEARDLDIEGRSAMSKGELAEAVAEAEDAPVNDPTAASLGNALRNADSSI